MHYALVVLLSNYILKVPTHCFVVRHQSIVECWATCVRSPVKFFLAEIPLRSPRKFFIFIIYKNIFGSKYPKNIYLILKKTSLTFT